MEGEDAGRGPASDGGSLASRERLARETGPSLECLVHRPSGPATGAPVLFLHGAFAGAWCWEESWLRRVAATGRHAAALSLRGHGGSEGREALDRAGLDDFFADLVLAIRAMPAPPVVVAHSFGGLLAQHLLGQVAIGALGLRGLVLVGSLPPEGLAPVLSWLGLSAWVGTDHGYGGPVFAREGPSALGGSSGATAYGWRPAEAALTGLAQALIPLPVLPAWTLGMPTLVLHGADDRLVPPGFALRTALYHGASCECVERVGHFPMLGPGAAAGAEVLCRWLDGRGL